MALALDLGSFVARLDAGNIPDDVMEHARTAVLNGFGIAFGSLNTSFAAAAAEAAAAMDGVGVTDGATILSDGRKSSVAGAAFANSALFHGRAQEDTCGSSHIGTVVLPIVTALVESGQARIVDYLPAVVAGYEVGGLLDQALAAFSTPRRFRASAVYGCIGGAAAAARALRLNAEQTAIAIANACAFTGGTLQSLAEAGEEWRYQVAVAARNGLAAALLAKAGTRGAPSAIEGIAGLAQAFGGTDLDVEALVAGLGHDWALKRNKFKPFPVCVFNQMSVSTALTLRDEIAGRPIRRFAIRMTPYEANYVGMASVGPFNSIGGTLLSGRFCVATSLLYGRPSLERLMHFDDAEVMRLVRASSLEADPELQPLTSDMRIELEDGTVIHKRGEGVPEDYALAREALFRMVAEAAAELRIGTDIVSRLDAWIWALPRGSATELVEIFSQARAAGGNEGL